MKNIIYSTNIIKFLECALKSDFYSEKFNFNMKLISNLSFSPTAVAKIKQNPLLVILLIEAIINIKQATSVNYDNDKTSFDLSVIFKEVFGELKLDKNNLFERPSITANDYIEHVVLNNLNNKSEYLELQDKSKILKMLRGERLSTEESISFLTVDFNILKHKKDVPALVIELNKHIMMNLFERCNKSQLLQKNPASECFKHITELKPDSNNLLKSSIVNSLLNLSLDDISIIFKKSSANYLNEQRLSSINVAFFTMLEQSTSFSDAEKAFVCLEFIHNVFIAESFEKEFNKHLILKQILIDNLELLAIKDSLKTEKFVIYLIKSGVLTFEEVPEKLMISIFRNNDMPLFSTSGVDVFENMFLKASQEFKTKMVNLFPLKFLNNFSENRLHNCKVSLENYFRVLSYNVNLGSKNIIVPSLDWIDVGLSKDCNESHIDISTKIFSLYLQHGNLQHISSLANNLTVEDSKLHSRNIRSLFMKSLSNEPSLLFTSLKLNLISKSNIETSITLTEYFKSTFIEKLNIAMKSPHQNCNYLDWGQNLFIFCDSFLERKSDRGFIINTFINETSNFLLNQNLTPAKGYGLSTLNHENFCAIAEAFISFIKILPNELINKNECKNIFTKIIENRNVIFSNSIHSNVQYLLESEESKCARHLNDLYHYKTYSPIQSLLNLINHHQNNQIESIQK